MRINHLIIIIMTLILLDNVIAIETCFNTSTQEVCFESDSQLYQQNIGLYEGVNNKFGVYVTNPDDELNQNWFTKYINKIKGAVGGGKIDISKMGDETKFVFQSPEDFYNLAQQKNALGNTTLYTQREINSEIRERTLAEGSKVLDWTFVLILVIVETLKIAIEISLFIFVTFALFRIIPWGLTLTKKIVFRFMVGGKSK